MKLLRYLFPATILLAVSAIFFQQSRADSNQSRAKALGLTTKQYKNGRQRASAVAQKQKPILAHKLSQIGLKLGQPVFLRAFKDERVLEVWLQEPNQATFKLFHRYPIAAASGSLGPKLQEGDRQVPEGFYFVPRSRMHPASRFHLAMNIGYPNAYDKAHGRTGSFIMIHGDQVSIGCLAMTDPGIEEIYTLCDAALRGGQKSIQVHLFPFRLTDQRLKKAADHEFHSFWQDLQLGYTAFERQRIPPIVDIRAKKYIIRPKTVSH